jgi:hypothetical protein
MSLGSQDVLVRSCGMPAEAAGKIDSSWIVVSGEQLLVRVENKVAL